MGEMKMQQRAGMILCGGESRRMGYAKALLPFGGKTMLEHMVDLLSPVVGRVVVVASPGQRLPQLGPNVLICHDTVGYQGPLTGMRSGFDMIDDLVESCFVTAVDAPLLLPELVAYEFEKLAGHDVVMPFDGTYYYPLTACYRVGPARRKIMELLGRDRHRPLFLFQEMQSLAIGLDEIRSVDPRLGSLENINTVQDYRRIMQTCGQAIPDEFQKPEIEVEFFGVPRLKSGVAGCFIAADTVDELLKELAVQFGGLVDTVIFDGRLHQAYQLVRGNSEFLKDPQTRLKHGDRILLMHMDAGG